jgi:hypothetical protein
MKSFDFPALSKQVHHWAQRLMNSLRVALQRFAEWWRNRAHHIRALLERFGVIRTQYHRRTRYWSQQTAKLENLERKGTLLPRQVHRLHMARSNLMLDC